MISSCTKYFRYIAVLIYFCCIHSYARILERDAVKEIQYIIEPLIEGQKAHLNINVTLTLKELPDTSAQEDTELSIILSTPFKEGPADLMPGFKNLKIITGASNITVDAEHPFNKHINGISSETIQLEYSIVPTIEDVTHIDEHHLYYKPVITSTFFHATGKGIFAYPAWITPEKRSIKIPTHIIWRNIPKGWNLANSFGTNSRKQTFVAQPEELGKGVFVGGNFNIATFDCLGYPIYIAMQDTWTTLTPKALGEIIIPLIRTQRAFWNDFEYPHFIITLLTIAPTGQWRNGDSATNGIKLFLPADTQIDKRLIHLIGHELFHIWNGQTITFDGTCMWFHQGFTDYYADQCALRAGVLSFGDYINAYNQVLADYYTSPAINMTKKQAQELTWQNYAAQKLPYQQGYIVAHNWNTALKKTSGNIISIDDIMRELRKKTAELKSVFSEHMLIDICKKYIPDIGDQIEQYITQGATIKPSPEAFGQRCTLIEKDVEIPDCGFDRDASVESIIVTGVRSDGPAYKAGLRDGDVIKELLSRAPNSTRDPVILVIQHKDNVAQRVEFYPAVQKTIKVPQYTLAPNIPQQS